MKRFTRAIASTGPWLFLGILVIDAVLVYSSLRTVHASNSRVDDSRQFITELERTLSVLKDAETGQRGYLLTGREDYLAPYETAASGLEADLARLRTLASGDRDRQARIDEVGRFAAEKMTELRETIALRRAGNLEAALEVVQTDRGKNVMGQARKVVAELQADEDRQLAAAVAASQSGVWRTVVTFTLTTGISLLLLVGVTSLQRREAREREEAAAAIRRSEAWLATTLSSIGDAVIATDERGHVRFMNPIAQTLTGWPQAEAVGRPMETVFEIINEDTRQPAEHPVARVIREGVIVGLANHTVLVTRGGAETPIEDSAAPIRNDKGDVVGVVMVFRDVTDARKAENALRGSEARKAAILASALDGIVSIDDEGKVVEWNPAAEATFGYPRGDVLGRDMCDLLIPPPLRDAHRKGLSHYLATGEGPVLGRRIEITALRADGTEFPIELAITPIATDGPPSFTAYLRDISERKRYEQAIAEQTRLAEFGRDVALALTESTSLGEMLNRTAEQTVRHLDAAFARIWTLNEAGDVLELRASAGIYTHLDGPHSRVPVGQHKIGLIAQERRPHLTNAVLGDPRVPAQDWAEREGMVAFAGYPLIVEDRLIGVWAMFARHPISEAALKAMESVAKGIALGIERKQAAEALAESESWLATTLTSVGDAVIATDERGRVRFMNPIAEALTGWPQDEAAGRPIEDVFHIINELTRQPAEHPVARVIREGTIVGLANHTILISKQGNETPIEDSAAPIRGDQGDVAGVVMVFRDVTEERAAQRLVQESAERHRTILESITDAFFALDRDWRFTYVNGQAEVLLGRARDDLLGKEFWDEFPPALGTEFERGFRRAMGDGVTVTFEAFYPPHERWYEVYAYPSADGLAVYFRDATVRRRQEEALREGERQFRTLADSIPQLAWMTRPDGFIFWYNKRWYEYTGTSAEDMEGWGWQSVHDPAELPRVLTKFKEALASGEPWEDIFPLRRHDGAMRWHLSRAVPVRDDQGRIVRWFGTNTDIDDRKQAEAERDRLIAQLDAERRHLQALIESSRDCIKELDLDGRLITISATGQRMLEICDLGDVIGKPWVEFWSGKEREAAALAVSLALTGGVGSFQGYRSTRAGTPKWWDVVVTPILDSEGKPHRLLAVSRDITERRRHEEERERLLAEAQEANNAKTQFLAVLSHELRTPLNPILLAASSMLDRPTPPDDFRPTLEMIRDNVNLQARLIDDLLDVMRIVRGKMPLHWEVADCHTLIRQAIQICQSEVFGKELRLDMHLGAQEHYLNADPARFQQVIWNLVKNAVKFTPGRGTITIRTRNQPGHGGAQLVIEVTDTGIGIEPEIMPLIFDPFQQGETKITRKFGGLGLGLAICRGIVESHGGTLVAESEGKDRGTTFRII
ncbi:MAG: PAS domain S-box protein, partial [Isosphaeraceae bacterium]|nr:PAS domain S-box protein [Isosphaeraceae bacterium]